MCPNYIHVHAFSFFGYKMAMTVAELDVQENIYFRGVNDIYQGLHV